MASLAHAAEAGKDATAGVVQESSALIHYVGGNWHNLLILAIVMFIIMYSILYMRKRFPIVREFFVFLKERRLWWMSPIVVIFVLLAVLIVTMEHSALAPFIYIIW